MAGEYHCPKCGKPVSVNQSTDKKQWIVYCPKCGIAEAMTLVENDKLEEVK